MTWSRHSLRIEPISLSAYPFCQGERGDVGTDMMISVQPDGDSWKVTIVQEGSVDDADRREMVEQIAARLKAEYDLKGQCRVDVTVKSGFDDDGQMIGTADQGLLRARPSRHNFADQQRKYAWI
jgi:hypothetical protein